jgi:uncharacterized membrane protein
MGLNIKSDILNRKTLIALICTIGILAVSYGIRKDNNVIFVIGMLFAIGGYVLIRRRIRKSIRNKP